MIIGIGIDSIEIERLRNWQNYQITKLQKIFTPEEIEYCLSNPAKSAERFAVRFAAKESSYKAIFPLLEKKIPLLKLCKYVSVKKTSKNPELSINWNKLELASKFTSISKIHSFISMTHTKTIATSIVIIELR